MRRTSRSHGYLKLADSMSTQEPKGDKTLTNRQTVEPSGWTDWTVIKRRREEGVGVQNETVLRNKKLTKLASDRGISRQEAARLLRYDDDVEVPAEAVR